MIRDDVCYLVKEDPSARGLFDPATLEERMVYCRTESVGSADFWRAQTAGVELTLVFILSDFIEYHGEKLIRYGDRYYQVARTYINGREIEITCEDAKRYVATTENGT